MVDEFSDRLLQHILARPLVMYDLPDGCVHERMVFQKQPLHKVPVIIILYGLNADGNHSVFSPFQKSNKNRGKL